MFGCRAFRCDAHGDEKQLNFFSLGVSIHEIHRACWACQHWLSSILSSWWANVCQIAHQLKRIRLGEIVKSTRQGDKLGFYCGSCVTTPRPHEWFPTVHHLNEPAKEGKQMTYHRTVTLSKHIILLWVLHIFIWQHRAVCSAWNWIVHTMHTESINIGG